jgi:hypothetical protein
VTGEDGLFFLGTNTQARLDSFFVKKEAPSNANLKRPAPAAGNVTLTAGLKLVLLREVSAFTTADTTKTASFPVAYQRVLSLGPSYDWAIARGKGNAGQLKGEIITIMPEMEEFFAKRHKTDKGMRLRPAMSGARGRRRWR